RTAVAERERNRYRAGSREDRVVSDEFDPLRRLRPDRVRPDDPGDPAVLSREKERLRSIVDETSAEAGTTRPTPPIYPTPAYGYRRYEATDLDGHRWNFTESFDSIRARGGHVDDEKSEPDC